MNNRVVGVGMKRELLVRFKGNRAELTEAEWVGHVLCLRLWGGIGRMLGDRGRSGGSDAS